VSWKQLRQAMEQELAERLAEQQADMGEQLAFVQVRGQRHQPIAALRPLFLLRNG
jgi:hypothetical protein